MANYQIALTNVVFDNSYKNVLRFDNRSEQEAYFNVNTLFSNSPDVNFNVGSLFATNIIYDVKDNEDISELLNTNYCIVKNNNENATIKYFYYFITNSMQDCGKRLKLSLELDIFQTYYLDVEFSDSMIFKAHLNRFIDNNDGTVSFDGTINSKLFEREDIRNASKIMTSRKNVSLYPDTELGNWLNENVMCWVYIYVDPYHNFTFKQFDSENDIELKLPAGTQFVSNFIETDRTKQGAITNMIPILAYPILSNFSTIYLTGETGFNDLSITWGDGALYISALKSILREFAELNNGFEYVYNVKISAYPPSLRYSQAKYTIGETSSLKYLTITNCSISNGKVLNPLISVNPSGIADDNFNTLCVRKGSLLDSLSYIYTLNADVETTFTTSKILTFNKNEIINANKNANFNPKLLSNDYFSIRISNQNENGFDYDLQKLNTEQINIKYSECMTPDNSKIYARISGTTGIYNANIDKNLTGFVDTTETSIILPTSAYQTMLANNKNFYLQNLSNRKFQLFDDLTKGIINTGGSIGQKSMDLGLIGAGFTAVGSGVSAGMNYAQSEINEKLMVDNLANSPSSYAEAQGNVIFSSLISKLGLIVEEWDILPNEKEMINDYMCQYGFNYNRIDNIKNVDNIRKFYNFVQADIETINGVNISDNIHKKFRECFANGVRFWNTDTFNYEKENYERWIENG